MIFSKDYSDDQLPYTHSDRFLFARVLISSIFFAVSIFLTALGKDTILGPIVLFIGIVWNLFLPLSSKYSLIASIMMGLCYGVVCVALGLVANAFLYLAYYVPMQYLACRNAGEDYILKHKEFSDRENFFVLFYYVLFFVGVYIFSNSINHTLICLIDAASATLLALSALARNARIRAYYKIRFAALGVSILLWALLVSSSVQYSGAWSILLMYIMYVANEIATMIYQARHYSTKEMVNSQNKLSEKLKKQIETKKKEYKNMQK